jgi:hypothetical protein
MEFPAFYSYACPAPPGFANAVVLPKAAWLDSSLSEFLLPYNVVRQSSDREGTLMSFLETTYGAAADLGGWRRQALGASWDCHVGPVPFDLPARHCRPTSSAGKKPR